MKLYAFLLNCILLSVLLTSCASSAVSFGPKKEVVSYDSKTVTALNPADLYLKCDYSNIELYSWDKKEIKFDITKKIRGIEDKAVLEKKLDDFNVDVLSDKDKVFFNSEYKGSIKSPADKSLDLKVYIPRHMSSISYKLDLGTIKMYDDIKCSLNADINMANTEINRFEGKLKYKANLGNLKITEGKMEKESEVLVDKGNISIKSEFEDVGICSFETGMGNIDLMLPSDTCASIENIGTVEVNQFTNAVYPSKIRLNTKMGKISVMKY